MLLIGLLYVQVISTVRLDALSQLEASALPSEFRLFSFGDNPTNKGIFKLDEEGAAALMASFAGHGVELAIDYEHQTFEAASNGKPAPAAGWFVPEVRADGLWAAKVRWTEQAANMLRNREYRYFSPTFAVDDKKRITRLMPLALTNFPASKNQTPLIAARSGASTEKSMSNEIAKIIGLKEDASEDQVAERVIALAGIERRLLEATDTSGLADAMTVVLSYKDAASERDRYKQMCRDWQDQHEREAADEKKKAIDSIIHGALLEGRVSLKDSERIERWRKHGEEFGAEQLKKLVAERDPRPVRQFQAPIPANVEAEKMRLINEYKKSNPGTDTGDAYVACAAANPALFSSEAQ